MVGQHIVVDTHTVDQHMDEALAQEDIAALFVCLAASFLVECMTARFLVEEKE